MLLFPPMNRRGHFRLTLGTTDQSPGKEPRHLLHILFCFVTRIGGYIFLWFSLRFDTFLNRSNDGNDKVRKAWIQEHHS